MSETTIIALVAALFGGGGLKFLEHILNRNKERADLATELRNELRTEVTALREEVKGVDDALDAARRRYFRLLANYHELRASCVEGGIKVPPFKDDDEDKE